MFAAFATMVDERKVVACDFMCRIASTKYLNSLGTTGLSEDSESRQVHVFHFGKLNDSRIHINSAKTNAFCLPRNCIPNRRLTLRIFNCQNIFDFVDFLFCSISCRLYLYRPASYADYFPEKNISDSNKRSLFSSSVRAKI